jgi:hypothetical protein
MTDHEVSRLHERIDGIQTALTEKIGDVEKGVSSLTQVVTENIALCKQCRPKVMGNGQPSYDVRIDRLEQWKIRAQWVLTSVAVPLAIYAGYVLLQKWL